MLHAGIGPWQLQNFLNALDLNISHTTLKHLEQEAGRALEELAKKSTQEAFQDEVELTAKNGK